MVPCLAFSYSEGAFAKERGSRMTIHVIDVNGWERQANDVDE